MVVWGPSRPLLNRVALALARWAGSELYWFEVESGSSPPPEPERAELARVDRGHLFGLKVREAAPDEPLANGGRRALVSDPDSSPEGALLRSLMGLPPRVRAVVLDRDPRAPVAALVVANTDRASSFYSGEAGSFLPTIVTLNRLGLTLVATTGRHPRRNACDFAAVFEVEGTLGDAGARVVCRAGDPRLGSVFVPEVPTPIEEFLRALDPSGRRSSQGAA